MTRRGLISDDSLMPDHPADTADKPEDVATLRAALLAAEARIAALEQIIHTFQRARFGQSAERIDTAQLALILGQEPPPPPANNLSADSPTTSRATEPRQRNRGMLPWVAARHALRGWEGQDLPPFKRDRGLVSETLMDALPQEDIEPIGWRASALMQPSRDAEKNSEAPSPSPASPAPMTAD